LLIDIIKHEAWDYQEVLFEQRDFVRARPAATERARTTISIKDSRHVSKLS